MQTTFPSPLDASVVARVERVLQDLFMGRQVSDYDLRQHAMDCCCLMEEAAERWQDGRESRETVEQWMHRRDEALRSLSSEWKAAREVEIQRAIAADHFIEQGDAGRARTGGHD